MNENEEVYYGVLLNRVTVDEEFSILIPEYILKGTIVASEEYSYFLDELDNSYSLVEAILESTKGVGFIISESDLKKRYPDLELKDAISEYYDEVRDKMHIGVSSYKDFSMKLTKINYSELAFLYDELEKMTKDSSIDDEPDLLDLIKPDQIKKSNDDKVELEEFDSTRLSKLLSTLGGTCDMNLPVDVYESLLSSKSYEELMKKLRQLYDATFQAASFILNQYGLVPEGFEAGPFIGPLNQPALTTPNENKVNYASLEFISTDSPSFKDLKGDIFRQVFAASVNNIYYAKTIEESDKAIEYLIDVFVNLACLLDEMAYNMGDIEKVKDTIYSLVDELHLIIEDNRDEAEMILRKEMIMDIKTEYEKDVDNMALIFDKYKTVEETKKKEAEKTKKVVEFRKVPAAGELDAHDMKRFFDEKIIGQDVAKKDVIAAIIMNSLSEDPKDRNSCLLVGPTGSGKTLIAETVSEYLDKPIEIIDTTQLTVPGYVGADIEDFLARLIEKAGGDVKKAEEGIVVFDEIDKKGSGKNDDISGKGVLNTLLPFINGTTYDVKVGNRLVHFNTSKLTIFATGAFTDVVKSKRENTTDEKMYSHTRIGFNCESQEEKDDKKEDIKYGKLVTEDFVKYGNMPAELMGRFSTISQLSGHTRESLRTILTDSNISALGAERKKLAKLGIDLKWTDGYLDAVAEKALELKTGARSLKSTVEESVKEARWEVIDKRGTYSTIVLTADTVKDNQNAVLFDFEGRPYKLIDVTTKSKKKTLTPEERKEAVKIYKKVQK